MKQYRITLTEDQMSQFEALVGEMPTKFGNPLINIYAPNLTVTNVEDTPPHQSPVPSNTAV